MPGNMTNMKGPFAQGNAAVIRYLAGVFIILDLKIASLAHSPVGDPVIRFSTGIISTARAIMQDDIREPFL